MDALQESLEYWQGCDARMMIACERIVRIQKDDPPVSFRDLQHAATIMNALDNAEELEIGTVLWHATAVGQDPRFGDVWLPTSRTEQGAKAFVTRQEMTVATYHRLLVASDGVRAIRVDADPMYQDEEEILVMPEVRLEYDKAASTTFGTPCWQIEPAGRNTSVVDFDEDEDEDAD